MVGAVQDVALRVGVGVVRHRLLQPGDGGLGDRQVAGGHDADDALARVLEQVHLAIGRDVVEPGIGAGVRQHHDAGLQQAAPRSRSRPSKHLLRWEEPVRIKVSFGASVPEDQRRADLRNIDRYAGQLARATGHRVSVSRESPNLHVLVVSEAERRSLASQLPKLVPGISPWMVRTVSRMRPNHLCMVVAEPHADRRRGYREAVVILRAEQSDLLRAACIEEELAQAMGLPNDCDVAKPSIFNDDQEYAFLTRRDEVLLRMLYSPSLASGMTAEQALPEITRLSRRFARP
jgi:hypothetical protein